MSQSEIAAQLAQRMTAMRESGRFAPGQLEAFARWIQEAQDEDLFRSNPYDYAAAYGLAPLDAIDLMVHAARAGIVDFAWGLVCPACTAFIHTRGGLKALSRPRDCAMCGVQAGQHLDDLVEVTFTVSPAIRRTRFHGRWLEAHADTAQLMADAGRVYFSSLSALGAEVRVVIRDRTRGMAVARRGESVRVALDLAEEGAWRVLAPSVHAVCKLRRSAGAPTQATVEVMDGYTVPAQLKLAPGPVTLEVFNRTDEAELLVSAICMEGSDDEEDHGEEEGSTEEEGGACDLPRPFLSGKQILSTQSFRELFRAETLPANASLEIRNLTFLFTDLKASTQLYDQVGDLVALGMVRSHFDVLRSVIAKRGGAIVKTIGDAVMATFVEPKLAVAAGVEMHARLREDEGARGLELKVGIHAGPCVAIDSNERLDYFGQTVNIAARVQALAEGRELVCTDVVVQDPAVAQVLREAHIQAVIEEAKLKGVSQAVRVHRARAL